MLILHPCLHMWFGTAVTVVSAFARWLDACRTICNKIGLHNISTQATPLWKSAHSWHQHKQRWCWGMASMHHAIKRCSRMLFTPHCGTLRTSNHVSSFSWRSLITFLMTGKPFHPDSGMVCMKLCQLHTWCTVTVCMCTLGLVPAFRIAGQMHCRAQQCYLPGC